jgi:hypothetical protein
MVHVWLEHHRHLHSFDTVRGGHQPRRSEARVLMTPDEWERDDRETETELGIW